MGTPNLQYVLFLYSVKEARVINLHQLYTMMTMQGKNSYINDICQYRVDNTEG